MIFIDPEGSPAEDGDGATSRESRPIGSLLARKDTAQPSGWLRQFNNMANADWSKDSSERPLPNLIKYRDRQININIFRSVGFWSSYTTGNPRLQMSGTLLDNVNPQI